MTKKEIKENNKKVRAIKRRNAKKIDQLEPLNHFFGFFQKRA